MADVYGQRLQSIVNTKYLPKVVDTALNSNVLLQRLVRAAKKWSGRTIRKGVKVSKNTTFETYRGLDAADTSVQDNRVYAEWNPSFARITVALPGDELSIADASDDAAAELMKLTIQSDTEDMADSLGDQLYATDGTGNGSKDFIGMLAMVDDGNSVATYGGISRSTYTSWASTLTAAASSKLSLAQMDTMWNSLTSGTVMPTLIVTTPTVFSFYEQLVRDFTRIEYTQVPMVKGGKKTGMGFRGLEYKGVDVVADEKCTSGYMYFLNEDYIDFYALKHHKAQPIQYSGQIEGNDYKAPVGLGFSWTNWILPTNADGYIGYIYFGGQFICTNPKRQGRFSSIAGI